MPSDATRLHPERFDILGPDGVSSTETSPLFAYGTLQLDEVLTTLIGRVPSTTPAQLAGWKATRLPDRMYPGLVPGTNGDHVAGLIVTGLTPAEWILLDQFEDIDYELRKVTLNNDTEAWAYAWTSEIEDRPWSLSDFVATDLSAYLPRCAAWLKRHQDIKNQG